ncbi:MULTISPECIES: acetolactate synthase large subunit [unclassified Microbacterium]|jgi:acetolactate synthase-1/2/3 large subunit|uniref:acetolactate synthase large subunit n=1 Tax=unclassified Microbacterium TaxID=2609290 RepID=UPI000CFCD260|nr:MULTISPECIES: acetolactate synthase large subunit [unclassified Microbacterium]PQZ61240.1 acetolactate synthase large subunit [Microbacterium sp. MYb43]PQZ82452.1 acetolactate synthase large subunit [Microbacterium sp. MYb40]PRB23849.1 acetolactate synthase large subunit [Microbacterium sp. MYb54]PRB29744.1 acetolactate synthase large subunit [Microbacterium sp. MYb50]PRB70898.1 acetolactate synthase large subunit [Microbacterium sp. MYb24]
MTADSAPAVPRPPARQSSAPEISGAEAVVRSLELLGVTDVFGLPGGAILPVYDPLMDAVDLRHILVRHEQGAGHAAEGYASASGKVGVCIATSGPGATNLVTAIADAYMDSVPMLAITGQVFSTLMGTDAFQEADIVGITMPITKHSFLVKDAADIPAAIAAAYEIAGTGRPGPVLVDITKDAQQAMAPFVWPPKIDLPGYRPVTKAHGKQIQAAAALLATAKKPVLYVGGGVIRGKASAELLELAESTGAPVVTTLMARGAFPDSHPQHLGMPGMHGTVPAVLALQEADLLVSLGARFDDRVTGKAALFAPNAKVVHVDIDPAEISKIRTADVPIVGDVRDVLTDLDAAFRGATADTKPDIEEWWSYLDGLRTEFPLGYAPTTDGLLAPQYVIQRIGELTGPEGIYASGVGQHQMWAAQFIKYERPNAWLNSGGAGTMGYSVPAAMGAKVAEPDRPVWAIDGDGCFQMTNQELATCTINNIPIKVAIINNSSLGMVRQWQTLFYDGRHSNTDLNTGHGTVRIPDFVKLAEAYGCLAIRVEKEEEVDAAIKLALETNDRPVVIDFVVSADSMVWPMVPQGVSNSYVQYAREHAPEFDEEV